MLDNKFIPGQRKLLVNQALLQELVSQVDGWLLCWMFRLWV